MKLFKTLFVLLFFFTLVNICFAQKNTVALINTKSFYASENGITRLVDALKSANPNFIALAVEEKDKEFRRIAGKCSDAKKDLSKPETVTLDAKEEAVCVAIKDIAESLEKFKKKQEFAILATVSDCDNASVLDLCYETTDVTKQFIEEYNGAKK